MIGKRLAAVLLPSCVLALAACGGGAPAASKTPQSSPSDEPRSVEDAQDQIDAARVTIDQAARQPAGSVQSEAPADAGPGKHEESKEKASDACPGQCKALASMKRAVDALCRMTGDSEGRCVSARRTFDASSTRIAACGCQVR